MSQQFIPVALYSLVFLAVITIVGAVLYLLGARLLKIPGSTFGRAVLTAFLGNLVAALAVIGVMALWLKLEIWFFLAVLFSLLISYFIVCGIYKIKPGKGALLALFGLVNVPAACVATLIVLFTGFD